MAAFFNSITSFLGAIYVANKATKSIGITTTLSAFINLIMNFALIRTLGIYAASISTLVSYGILAIYRMMDIKKYVNLIYDYKHMIIVIFLITIELLLCYFQNTYLNILNIIAGIIIFFLLNKNIVQGVYEKILLHK